MVFYNFSPASMRNPGSGWVEHKGTA